MPNFSGTLNSNEIFASIYNMIISQEVFADNIGKHQTLVDKARVDGSAYGDQKLYYATDILKSREWLKDAESSNLLATNRPDDPSCQALVIDQFRIIPVTIDNYLSKRAWTTEGAFASFNGIVLGWIRETKKVYDGTLYNTYLATAKSGATVSEVGVDLATGSGHPLYNLTGVEKEQMTAMLIAQALADLIVEMGDYSRDFNDYGYMRSYADQSLRLVWNAKFINKLRKVDLPTIFHKEGLIDKFEEDVLPKRYFGTVITSSNVSTYSASTPAPGKPINSSTHAYTPGTNNANGTVRSMVEKDYTLSGTSYHCFPGDELVAGATIDASSANFLLGEVYIEQDDVICKVLVKLPPIMSGFEVGTSFFNPISLTENHYLIWSYNKLEYLKNYPLITVKAV